LAQRAESPAALRRAVTSPGGTTEAALKVLLGDDRHKALIRNAVRAATTRSRELSSAAEKGE
jgi:pyrroline-5-carboxylate reductase